MSRRISFVVAPGFELLDLSGPMCAFTFARELYGAPYDIGVVSSAGGSVLGCAGLSIETLEPARAGHGDTVIVVGGPEAHLPERHPGTTSLSRSLAPATRRMASVCTGAFYLAEAGVLDGHRATTHWRWAPLLRSRFPSLSVDADRIYVTDRKVWTSAGITAGIDMALAMIEADFGTELSKSVARDLVVYHRRPGGQSQFSTILDWSPPPVGSGRRSPMRAATCTRISRSSVWPGPHASVADSSRASSSRRPARRRRGRSSACAPRSPAPGSRTAGSRSS